MNLYKWFVHF